MAAKTKKPLVEVAKLTKAQAKVELMRLVLELEGHDKRYYQDDAPSVTDAEYDALRQRFNANEKKFPEFVSSDSPSQKVGAAPSGRFRKVRHAVPMLSLDNAFAEADVLDFAARADHHLLISKDALDKGKRVATRVNALAADHRREEIARMLAGAEITAEARAAAERLLKAATA